jgi:hypothetical protein
MTKKKGISKTDIILSCVILILSLALIERQATVKEYQKDYEYFEAAKIEYDARIIKLNEMILRIEVKQSSFDSVANNVSQNENFLTTASPQEILAYYDQNKLSLGGE